MGGDVEVVGGVIAGITRAGIDPPPNSAHATHGVHHLRPPARSNRPGDRAAIPTQVTGHPRRLRQDPQRLDRQRRYQPRPVIELHATRLNVSRFTGSNAYVEALW